MRSSPMILLLFVGVAAAQVVDIEIEWFRSDARPVQCESAYDACGMLSGSTAPLTKPHSIKDLCTPACAKWSAMCPSLDIGPHIEAWCKKSTALGQSKTDGAAIAKASASLIQQLTAQLQFLHQYVGGTCEGDIRSLCGIDLKHMPMMGRPEERSDGGAGRPKHGDSPQQHAHGHGHGHGHQVGHGHGGHRGGKKHRDCPMVRQCIRSYYEVLSPPCRGAVDQYVSFKAQLDEALPHDGDHGQYDWERPDTMRVLRGIVWLAMFVLFCGCTGVAVRGCYRACCLPGRGYAAVPAVLEAARADHQRTVSSRVSSSKAVSPPTGGDHVKCPSCESILRIPAHSPVFRCPCGQLQRAPTKAMPQAKLTDVISVTPIVEDKLDFGAPVVGTPVVGTPVQHI